MIQSHDTTNITEPQGLSVTCERKLSNESSYAVNVGSLEIYNFIFYSE